MRSFALLIAALLSAALTAQTIPGFPPLVDLIKPNPVVAGGGPYASRIAVDAAGDVYLVTSTTDDAPGATKIGTQFGTGDLLIVKMDARLEQVRFATVIGVGPNTSVNVLRVDASDNIYLAGITYSDHFPYTNSLGSSNSFVLKLSAAGDKLLYATQLGFDPFALDIDASGAAYFGGSVVVSPSVVWKLSPTGDAIIFQKSVGSWSEYVYGIKVLSDGKTVFLTSTKLGALDVSGADIEFSVPMPPKKDGYANQLATDVEGNIYVTQPDSTVLKFSSAGTPLGVLRVSDTPHPWKVTFISAAADGSVYLMGTGGGASFPTHRATEVCRSNVKPPYGPAGVSTVAFGDTELVVFNADGTLRYSSMFNADGYTFALSNGERYLYVNGAQEDANATLSWSGVFRADLSRIPTTDRLNPSCLAHGATYAAAPASPGAIMTIYGSNLGPLAGVSFALVNNLVPTELAGTTVTVDGIPAPILYAQDSQINFIVPWRTKTQGDVEICINRGGERACLDATAVILNPAAFRYQNLPMIVYQDGSLNSQSNPVHKGQYVSLYLTGAGALTGPLTDGAVWDLSLRHMIPTVTAWIYGDSPYCTSYCEPPPTFPVDVVYAGSAPFLVEGASQINIRIPELVPTGIRSMALSFDGQVRDTVTIWIAP